MKTIEERAKEFVQAPCTFKCDICETRYIGMGCLWKHDAEVFSLGAKSEHEELTRWNSPECPPEDHREILVKVKNGYNIASYNPDKGYCIKGGFYAEILGWREIHE